ncbi:hypothetical protein M446_2770 [Methylobacterium sp. 4-46]|uniref:hypothetical protein n=1 Tax=unclassified Methylobacterium TaxID=2615210 RepID=UPI000152D121|nr:MULTISPECIES: hypothetical protein [Methylobacterium]ACA17208.1 hypothetical protein M446_2770 [Methylobacterium sp. 4-46]WFT82890.1 hypothetical protein QA634_14035 [Methylobacterium nodulans]
MTCRCNRPRPREAESLAGLSYRAYLIDGQDHIVGVERIDAEDDVEALLKARGLDVPFDIELWDRDRRVIGIQRHRMRAARN